MTDQQLRDQAVTHLEATTISYPEYARRVKAGRYTPKDGSATEWGKAFTSLAKIGVAPAAIGNWWAPNSFINQPIPPNPKIDPQSAKWVAMLNNDPSVNSIYCNKGDWSTPVYHATLATPRVVVSLAIPYYGASQILIPYQAGWLPDPQQDGHIVIIDQDGLETEFQGFDANTLTAHSVAQHHIYTDDGATSPGNAVSGLPIALGLIRPEDIQIGEIRHGLRCATPVNDKTWRYPADHSDGQTPGGLPMGALIQLDPALNLTPFGLDQFGTMFAQCLQAYGMYNGDSGGGLASFAQNNGTYTVDLPNGLPKTMVPYLRVLA